MGLANKLQGAPAAAPGGAMPSTAANQMPPSPPGYPQANNPVSMHMPPAQLPAGQTPIGHNMPYGMQLLGPAAASGAVVWFSHASHNAAQCMHVFLQAMEQLLAAYGV